MAYTDSVSNVKRSEQPFVRVPQTIADSEKRITASLKEKERQLSSRTRGRRSSGRSVTCWPGKLSHLSESNESHTFFQSVQITMTERQMTNSWNLFSEWLNSAPCWASTPMHGKDSSFLAEARQPRIHISGEFSSSHQHQFFF